MFFKHQFPRFILINLLANNKATLKMTKSIAILILSITFIFCFSCKEGGEKIDKENKKEKNLANEWQILFNGENLDGWIPKVGGFDPGVNGLNTFRVNDGILDINYDEYDTFSTQFGHLFYEEPFSSYHMEVEYRFKGEQTTGGPGWAIRNSGIMFHSQDPMTMLKDQDFPICVEFQFLGGNGTDERSTGNLCTPNSHVTMDGELFTPHCVNSDSKTFHGDQWVTAGLIVYEDSIVHHLIEGDTVMTYTKPIYDATNEPEGSAYIDGQAMKSGYVALQAESHPMDYRSAKIKDLSKK